MTYDQESDQVVIIALWGVGRDLCCTLINRDFDLKVMTPRARHRNLGSKSVPRPDDQIKC